MTRSLLAGAILFACCAIVVARQPNAAVGRIQGEVTRLAGANLPDRMVTSLDTARRAAEQGRAWLALDELQEAWTFDAATRWASGRASVKAAEQFRAEWRGNEPRAVPPATARIPAIVEAIAASNAIRAPATWRASLPYSEDAGMDAGLYYLGEAQAFGAFAAFCRSLPFDATGNPPAFRSIATDLTALEADVAKSYAQATAETRPRFIRISVGLKIARSLDGHRDYGAALYQFLLAAYRHAMIAAPSTSGAADARVAAARARLRDGGDHSIAELFFQRAGSLADTREPSAAQSSVVVADVIVPAYLRLIQP